MAVITYRDALNRALREEMRRDDRVFIMGEEVGEYDGAYKVTKGLLDEFGEMRVRDTPIAENGFAGLGVGAAVAGLRPVVEFMTWNFALLAYDAIVNSAAKIRHMSGGQFTVPIVFRGPGGSALQLAAQHSQVPDPWYANIPGLKVCAPATPADAMGLLKTAIRDDDPVVFIEGELLYNVKGEVPDEEHLVPLGVADIKRAGEDVTIVAHSKMLHVALQAAEKLSAEHEVEAEVVDLRSLRPLDLDTYVASVKKTNRAVVVEEGWPVAGIGAQVVDDIQREAFDYLDAPVARVSGLDVPMHYARALEKIIVPDADAVVKAARHVCYLD
ncbi:MAG: pyruvate dehydrogenase complex E1 component subunit beta [Candidatus Palauibacterales bacterium]|jgi:pyruvate dehydrogenase E1 component subunit beta|nr:pyruvate dehydrogenase complex E1 component subunit beta [Candidatus Palauibacterales bacterium]